MGYSVLCLCEAVILIDPGSIGIGMVAMRSCKERATIGLLYLSIFCPDTEDGRGCRPYIRPRAYGWSGAALPAMVPHQSGLVLRRLRYWGGKGI